MFWVSICTFLVLHFRHLTNTLEDFQEKFQELIEDHELERQKLQGQINELREQFLKHSEECSSLTPNESGFQPNHELNVRIHKLSIQLAFHQFFMF